MYSKIARFVLFRPIKKRSFNLLCALDQQIFLRVVKKDTRKGNVA